jgi:hypothetical protein
MKINLPEIQNYVAHPQSVWFETHWRPLFEVIQKENAELKIIGLKYSSDIDSLLKERGDLKIKLDKAIVALEFYATFFGKKAVGGKRARESLRQVGVE